MMTAILALRRAMQAHLVADAELVALLGGPRIHDEPPRGLPGPHVAHGDVDARDWSSQGSDDCEQDVEIVVWAATAGETARALAIAGRIGDLLHEADLAIEGHRLVNLRQTGLAVRRDGRSGRARVAVRLRAVTERI